MIVDGQVRHLLAITKSIRVRAMCKIVLGESPEILDRSIADQLRERLDVDHTCRGCDGSGVHRDWTCVSCQGVGVVP